MQTKRQINRIKHLLNDKSLSFIIGSGFSRNMSDQFVDWNGLLKPIVKEMYLINDDKDVKHKIQEIGYLGIAEEYVRRKGYHEAIDVYIEEHTPIVVRKDNEENLDEPQYIVMLNNEEVGIADITCHKLLFDLDVKHIFTFNYDNCLDIIGNTKQSIEILGEIRTIQSDLQFLERAKERTNNFLDEATENLTPQKDASIVKSENITTTRNFCGIIEDLNQRFPNLSLSVKKSSIEDVRNKVEDLMESKEANLQSLQKQRQSCYQLISSAGMLSLTDGKKNIFKLHGTIRLNANSEYGFDGDAHCNYIITASDYRDYPLKHEPFVDFMKISLLKGAFCIIGFSGDDPNFLSWMSWVKEVIDKNPEIKAELSQKNSARFFYIHSGNEPLPNDKILLLKNHYIEYVDLFKIFKGCTHKENIIQFLESLSPKTSHFSLIKKAWNNIYKVLSKELFNREEWDISAIYDDIEFLYNSKQINRIPAQTNLDNIHRDYILRVTHRRFNKKWDKASESELKLVLSAIREELLLPSHYFEENEYNNILRKTNMLLKADLEYLSQKERALCNQNLTNSDQHPDYFIQIWKNLYSFNFKEAKKLIDAWNPSNENPIDRMRQLMFKAILAEDVFEQIPPLTNRDLYDSVQDYINALELLPLISRHFLYQKDGGMNNAFDFSEEIGQLQNDYPYIKNANQIIDSLISKVKGYNKPLPFGNKSRSFTWGSGCPEFVTSFKVLSIFFELCRPLYISNIILFPEEKWNVVCENLYKYYPYPCLFYSLQYNSPKLTTSISQKILYCDDLKEELPRIVKTLFKALRQKECPDFYCESIMLALPILLIGVDSKQWNKDFILFFNKLKPLDLKSRQHDDLNYTHEKYYNLISFGLNWLSDKQFKIRIIYDILSKPEGIGNWENMLIIKASHSLNDEDLCSSKFFEDIRKGLLWLCKNSSKPAQIYVLLNLIKFTNKATVQECLESLPDTLIESDCTLMSAIPHYVQKDSILISRIKQIILKSHYLWCNGIKKDGVSIGCSFLEIAGITSQIIFTDDELHQIWNKMKCSLSQIQNMCNSRQDRESTFFLNHFDTILDEMKLFVENNSFSEISKEEYEEVHGTIVNLRIHISSNTSHNISELLIEDLTNDVISMLVNIKPEERFTKYQSEYILLANKLVLKNSQYLNSCMKHFSWIVETYANMIPQVIFKPILKNILITYTPYFNKKIEWDITYARKDDFEKGLIKIYSVFRIWGGEDNFWESYKPRFINA